MQPTPTHTPSLPAPGPARPLLKPALSRAWRDARTLQFGAVRSHATVLDNVDQAVSSLLELVDGTRDHPALLAAGAELGLAPEVTAHLLDSLAQGGLLDDAVATAQALGDYPPSRQALLRPDLASLSLVHPLPPDGPAVLQGRARARVEVRGAGRVGAALAAALAAGGVGAVELTDRGRVLPEDCSPAGFPATEIGRLRSTAGRELVHRAAGAPAGAPAGARHGPDSAVGPPALVVLAPRDGSAGFGGPAAEAQQLMRSGTPHLYLGVVEHLGVVGPLVIPGGSACGRCAALGRRDEDELWPRLLAQLADQGPGRARSPACDGALATTVAGLAALHIGLFLAGELPPSVDGWYEVSAVDGMARRLRLREHPDCGCRWESVPAAAPAPQPGSLEQASIPVTIPAGTAGPHKRTGTMT